MSRIVFSELPDSARLWIFAADRPLAVEEQAALSESVLTGLAAWNAHGSPVTWSHHLEREQFLLIGVDETHTALSGCSIDGAVRQIRGLEARLGIRLLDNTRVFYREGAEIRVVSRPEFRVMVAAGRVTADTVVYNTILGTVGEFRRGLWEVPLRLSWHATAFPVQA